MKINELKDGTKNVNLEAKVTETGEIRDVTTKFGKTKVMNATIEDDSGSITLVLWGENTEKIKEGDNLKIENGYVKEWNNNLQISVGKFGKMVVTE